MDINYSQPLSVNAYDLNNIVLFPNPVNYNFTIKGLDSSVYQLQIFSIQGQIIKEINDFYNEQTVAIDELGKGIYFVKIQSGTQAKTIKIVKN